MSFGGGRGRSGRESFVYAIGEHVDEPVRKKPDHTGEYVALLTEDYGGRNRRNIEQGLEAVIEINFRAPMDLSEERLHEAAILVGIDGQEDHVAGVLELGFHLLIKRVLGAAGSAPGGPEIDHDHFAEQRGELQLVALESGEREFHRI